VPDFPPVHTDIVFRPLRREELDLVLEWAAREGWNPGLHDAAAFWAADPGGFWGMETGGQLIGSLSIVSYGESFGFVGLFIVEPSWRGRGMGRSLWRYALGLLRERLGADTPLALDGVFAMQASYARSDFVFTHRNLRMEGVGEAAPFDPGLLDLSELPLAQIAAYDRWHFPAERGAFLEHWFRPPDGRALGLLENGTLAGCGVVRRCRRGFKIGPLFAATPAVAERLFTAFSAHAAGEPLFLDTPENNPEALALAARHGMRECFGCARMIAGRPPEIPWHNIYGVTTFELG